MLYIGYQFGGFQTGYQTFPVKLTKVAQGGGANPYVTPKYYQSYELSKREWEAKQQREKLELEAKELKAQEVANELKLQALELERLKDLADEKLQQELMLLIQRAQFLEAEQLRIEAAIRFFMAEEDAILVILLSLPFNS